MRLAGAAVPAAERRECLARRRAGRPRRRPRGRLLQGDAAAPRAGRGAASRDPSSSILDEPTSALDPIGRADVRDLLLSLRQRGVAVLLNSHLIGEVERVCDRVVILDKGRVAAAGTLAELLGRREVRLRLDGVTPATEARLAAAGPVHARRRLVHRGAARRRGRRRRARPRRRPGRRSACASTPSSPAASASRSACSASCAPGGGSGRGARGGGTVIARTVLTFAAPHRPRGVAPARPARARRADARAAGAQRVGVLPHRGRVRRRAHQRRGPPRGLDGAEPGDVRAQPDRRARHRVPRRPDAGGRDRVGHGAGGAGAAGPPLGRARRQVAGARRVRRRLRRPRRPRAVRSSSGRPSATGRRTRPAGWRCSPRRRRCCSRWACCCRR